MNRRKFINLASIGTAAAFMPPFDFSVKQLQAEVLNPYNRAPVSLIIDDSTCLVNMAHFGIPQFGEVLPEQYKQDWRKLPREIPDSFVREFGEWSHENGIKGKYSIVPYPACTGWMNRFIPGWTKKELEASLELVRTLIMPNWDIHPEMISHTRVIDIKTGRPFPYPTPEYMENWEWSQTKSSDELAAYQAYALNILKEAGLTCEGITTPGGYGERNQVNLAKATSQSVKDVFGFNLTHFFRDVFTEKDQSVAPKIMYSAGLDGPGPECSVSIIGCTDDWFGNWDGLGKGYPDRMITPDLSSGRLVDVIASGEPAIMVCHWPGIYYNGDKQGFNVLKTVVSRLGQKYNNLIWMRQNDIARYWAAKELTKVTAVKNSITLEAPFATNGFTLKLNFPVRKISIKHEVNEAKPLKRVDNSNFTEQDCWFTDRKETWVCAELKQGKNEIIL